MIPISPTLDLRTATRQARERTAAGGRFAALFADDHDGTLELNYVVEIADRLESYAGRVSGSVESLSAEIVASVWYERELRDRYGIEFTGLSDLRQSVPPPAAEQLLRSKSPEVSTVLYGPVRSGIVESARWIVETAGEDFIAVHPSMFFKHRGIEERFIGVPLELAPFVAEHVCGATASSHAVAFCRAVETALDVEVPARARAARSILVELERIHQHLDSLAKLADDGSLAVGAAQTFAAKERVHRLLAQATGNRFARGTFCVGGTRDDVFAALEEACEKLLDEVERETEAVVEGLFGTQSLLDRLLGTGALGREIVSAYGGVGPVARGSAVSCDARTREGWLFTSFEGDEALAERGDALARSEVRRAEIRRSFQLIRSALDAAPRGSHRAPVRRLSGRAIARVESPQGELLYYVRLHDGLRRVAIRSASYANWPLFVPSLAGNIFTDFSFIEHSFGLLQAETDR